MKKNIKKNKEKLQRSNKIYRENKDKISETNLKFYKSYNLFLLVMLVALYLSTFVSSYAAALMPTYIIYIIVTIIELIISNTVLNKVDKLIMPMCYFGIFKAYSFCIFSSVIFNTHAQAITFYVFLFMIPIAFLMRFMVMFSIQVVSVVAFSICVVVFKDQEFILSDIFNVAFFFLTSLFVAQQVGTIRLHNIELARHAVKNSHEIENNRNLLQGALKDAEISVWKYNIAEHKLYLTNTVANRNGLKNCYENVPESIIESGFVFEDSIETFRKIFNDVSNGSNRSEGEVQLFTKDKLSNWWIKISLFQAEGEHNNTFVGTAIDITDQKSYEYFYKEQMRIVSDDDGNFIEKACWNLITNERERRIDKGNSSINLSMDISCDDARKYLVSRIIGKEKQEEVNNVLIRQNLIDNFRKGKNEYNLQYQRTTQNSDVIWVNTKVKVCLTPNNEVVGFVFSKDVTDEVVNRKILDQLLYNDYEFFGTVVVKTGQSIVRSVKPEMKNTVESLGVYNIKTDYNESTLKSIEEYIILDESESAKEVEEKISLEYVISKLEESDSYIYTFSTNETNGKLNRKQLKYSYIDDTKQVILYYRSDITELYLQEQERLNRMKELLEETKKANEAKSRFLSRMSHDMRTPMNGIIGMTKLSLELPNLTDEVHKNLSAIENSSEFLLSLINDTLDMSRMESDRVELNSKIIQSADFAKSVIATVMPLANEKNINIDFKSINAGLGYIRVDPIRLQQIFLNILSNAVKFTPKDGSISIIVECMKKENNTAFDRIIIEDNGIGMSEEFLTHVYEPFSQENDNTPGGLVGTGLGLSIVKSLVELMGGKIEIESEIHKGTKVTVYLNFELVPDYVQNNQISASTNADENVLAGKRILLVEDHPLNATIATKILEKKDIVVEHVENGKIALERFSKMKPNYFDAILMDVRMPVMDGFTATREIRKLDREDAKEIPIIALSANAFDEDIKTSLENGMNAHLAKPINPPILFETLSKQISSKK